MRREGAKLIYSIDLERDVIERIAFVRDSGGEQEARGELRFSYLEEVGQQDEEFSPPGRTGSAGAGQGRLGMLWLVKLADSDW